MRGQRHASVAPYPRERPGTHCTGGWVGLRAGLDRCGKSHPQRDSNPGRPARRQSLYRLSYPAHWACRRNFNNQVRVMESKTGRQRKLDTVVQGAGREVDRGVSHLKRVARYVWALRIRRHVAERVTATFRPAVVPSLSSFKVSR